MTWKRPHLHRSEVRVATASAGNNEELASHPSSAKSRSMGCLAMATACSEHCNLQLPVMDMCACALQSLLASWGFFSLSFFFLFVGSSATWPSPPWYPLSHIKSEPPLYGSRATCMGKVISECMAGTWLEEVLFIDGPA